MICLKLKVISRSVRDKLSNTSAGAATENTIYDDRLTKLLLINPLFFKPNPRKMIKNTGATPLIEKIRFCILQNFLFLLQIIKIIFKRNIRGNSMINRRNVTSLFHQWLEPLDFPINGSLAVDQSELIDASDQQ